MGMNELIIIHEHDDGGVTVCDPWGETVYLTKEEYKIYLKNIKKLEENE